MQYCPLIYSRTFKADYRQITVPDRNFCPQDVTEKFVLFMRAVINVDNPTYGHIETIRWVCYKHNGFILWGAGLMNHQLPKIDKAFGNDGHRPIRSFIGIVFHDDTAECPNWGLPIQTDFLAYLFQSYVAPRWEESNWSPPQLIRSTTLFTWHGDTLDLSKPETLPTELVINKDPQTAQVFPQDLYDPKTLFRVVLTSSSASINLVINLNKNHHAVEEGFLNATTAEAREVRIFRRPIAIQREPDLPEGQGQYRINRLPPTSLQPAEGISGDQESSESSESFWDSLLSLFRPKRMPSTWTNQQTTTKAMPSKKMDPFHGRAVLVNEEPAQHPAPLSEVEKPAAKPLITPTSASVEPLLPETITEAPVTPGLRSEVLTQILDLQNLVRDGSLNETNLYSIRSFLEKYLPPKTAQ